MLRCSVHEPKPPPNPARGPNPLPIETVRDLLGIVRVLYALECRNGNHGCARDLQHAGKQLRRALELAIRKGDTAAHAAAWRLANEAIGTVARAQWLNAHENLAVAVDLASERVRVRQYSAEDRGAKRAARIKRG